MAKRKPSPEDARRRLLLDAFWMPSVQTMVSRKSSITNAFVNAILPATPPTLEEIEQALQILKMDPADLRCSYCGDKASEWDHLRPIVDDQRPTGYISEIANLVPACGKCNQSKGNSHWREWMLRSIPRSPTGRGVKNVSELIARLEAYGEWKSPTKLEFEALLGAEKWAKYW
jgi:HNH endonuclease